MILVGTGGKAVSAIIPSQFPEGAPSCPCITSPSPLLAPLKTALVQSGQADDYGTTGCLPHDAGISEGCEANQSSYCLNPWCYVDVDRCAIDEDMCKQAGGVVGSDASPYCRSRRSNPSPILAGEYYYSYSTCGVLNT
jgi:hypothetical protein